MYINIEPRKINAKINLNKPESFFCPWHFVNMLTVPLGSSSSYLQLLFTSAKLLFFFNFFNFWDLQIALSHAWNVAMWFWCVLIWWMDRCWVYLWFTVVAFGEYKTKVFFFLQRHGGLRMNAVCGGWFDLGFIFLGSCSCSCWRLFQIWIHDFFLFSFFFWILNFFLFL